jgi:hypothetical protein
MARTAVVAGTASMTVNALNRRSYARQQQAQEAQAYEASQSAPAPSTPAAAAAAAAAPVGLVDQLGELTNCATPER